jgi:hypothetical protein
VRCPRLRVRAPDFAAGFLVFLASGLSGSPTFLSLNLSSPLARVWALYFLGARETNRFTTAMKERRTIFGAPASSTTREPRHRCGNQMADALFHL